MVSSHIGDHSIFSKLRLVHDDVNNDSIHIYIKKGGVVKDHTLDLTEVEEE